VGLGEKWNLQMKSGIARTHFGCRCPHKEM